MKNDVLKQPVIGAEITTYDPQGKVLSTYVEPMQQLKPDRCQVEITDIMPDGSEIVRVRKPMDSFVSGFLRVLQVQFEQATKTITDTSGVAQSIVVSAANFNVMAAIADMTFGVVVGTGSNTVAITDTTLQSQITEGTAAAKTITNVTNSGGLFKITATTHGFVSGNSVVIASVTGTGGLDTAVNNGGSPWTITRVDANSFTLNGSTFVGAYTSGGTATCAAQLNHQAVQIDSWTTVGQVTSFVIKRRFINNTASTINIKEKGIVVNAGGVGKILIVRELVGISGHDVVAGGTSEVRFTIGVNSSGNCVGNLVKCLQALMANSTLSLIISNGETRSLAGQSNNVNGSIADTAASNGRLSVGLDSTAVDINQYQLLNQIQEGTGAAKTITNVTNDGTGKFKIASTAHGFNNGNTIVIAGVTGTGGMTAAVNNTWTIIVGTDANSFILSGSTFVGSYSSGGTATQTTQLNHQATNFDPIVVGATSIISSIKRTVINNSASNLTIHELGLMPEFNATGFCAILWFRLVLGVPQTVVSGAGSAQIKLNYGVQL